MGFIPSFLVFNAHLYSQELFSANLFSNETIIQYEKNKLTLDPLWTLYSYCIFKGHTEFSCCFKFASHNNKIVEYLIIQISNDIGFPEKHI